MPSTSTPTTIRAGRKSTSPLQYGRWNRSLKSEPSSDELDAHVLAPEATQDKEYKQLENECWKETCTLQVKKIEDLQHECESLKLQASTDRERHNAEMKEHQRSEELWQAELVRSYEEKFRDHFTLQEDLQEVRNKLHDQVQATEAAQDKYKEIEYAQQIMSETLRTRIQSLEQTCQDLQLQRELIEAFSKEEKQALSGRIRELEDELDQLRGSELNGNCIHKSNYENLKSAYEELRANLAESHKEKETTEQPEIQPQSSARASHFFSPNHALWQELQRAKKEIKHLKGMRGPATEHTRPPSSLSDHPLPSFFASRHQTSETANTPATEFLPGRNLMRESYEYHYEW